MDSINLKTETFTITVYRDKVTSQVTLDDGMEYAIVDITVTTLGKLLLAQYSKSL